MIEKPASSPVDGDRDPRTGRFAPGNPGGPGNPHAGRIAKLRSALLEAVTAEDVREVVAALVTEAKAGNVQAMREFFNRLFGKPEAIDAIERLNELEAVLERLEERLHPGEYR